MASDEAGSSAQSREKERLERTLAMLPAEVGMGLEIGCYDFRLTDLLRAKMDLVSIDLPRQVTRHEDYRLAFGDIQQLPFGKGSFDMVVCTEVLEHLPDRVLNRGVQELKRVSRKYILISVPDRQRVWNELFKCSACGFTCNSMGHLQCFDKNRLTRLLEPARLVKFEFVGRTRGYAPDILYTLARRFGNAWHDHSFGNCPSLSGLGLNQDVSLDNHL